MSRDIKFLTHDLRRWVDHTEQEARKGIAHEALQEAADYAPEWSGFLKDQGYAFIEGKLYETTSGTSANYRRVAIPPKGGYEADVTIVFRAGRIGNIEQKIFDYAYYVGVKNPNWLRFANTKFWIEAALNPENSTTIGAVIYRSFKEAWRM